MTRHFMAMLALAALGGCMHATGPVLGEWRGQSPGASRNVPKTVDVTLNGSADAPSGSYHFSRIEADPTLLSGHDQDQWGGTWVRSQRVVNGHPVSIFTLKALLSGEIDTYALEPGGTLRPVDPDGMPDMTPAGSRYTLAPVPPRNAL